MVESIAEEIPNTVNVSQHISKAVIEPLFNGERPRSLCIECKEAHRRNMTLLELVAEVGDMNRSYEDRQFSNQDDIVMHER